MNRARDLLVQGGNDATDQTSRNAIATELGQIKQAASQSYRGSYVFSGTATSTRPYEQCAGQESDLDAALAIAARIPGARYGSIEVRPIWVYN